MLVYPFHKCEIDTHEDSVCFVNARSEIACQVFKLAVQVFEIDAKYDLSVEEFIGDFGKYVSIYGYEAVCLSLLLHPVSNKIELNSHDAFAAWKIANRVWTMLNTYHKYKFFDVDNYVMHANIRPAVISIERKKLHTYVASLARIVKKFNQHEYMYKEWQYMLAIVKTLFPCMYKGFLKNR